MNVEIIRVREKNTWNLYKMNKSRKNNELNIE
jgi:hypothetical protein